jgi:two-component system LytT family response regulator
MAPASKKSSISASLKSTPNQESSVSIQTQFENSIPKLDIYRKRIKGGPESTYGEQSKKYIQRMLVKSDGKWIILKTYELNWIEAWGDYVRLHNTGKTFISRQKIGEIESLLDPQQFVRIGRSAIVQIDRIRELEPMNHGDFLITLQDDTRLNLSRNYRNRLSALFHNTL